jgi:23S rRNA pseudouridine1911/1915/1917 synthase
MRRGSERETIEILYEDDVLLAAVKPAGLPTANAPAGRPSLFTWLKERLGRDAFVGIVSRLDAPVSGVVVVAKTPAAAADLAEQFRDRAVKKRYLAVVSGRFPAPLGEWVEWNDRIVRGEGRAASRLLPAAGPEQPAAGSDAGAGQGGGRPAARRERTAHDEADPQDARTRARVVHRAGEVSLVELEPVTGRRHQLRAQLAARGCPIVGDRLYGSRLPFPRPGGIALHAARVVIHDSATGRERAFSAPPEAGWRQAFPSLSATLEAS